MRRLPLVALCAVCVLTSVTFAQSPPAAPFQGLIDHVSVNQRGSVPYNAEVWYRSISGDGRYVVFNSSDSYLATDDYDDYNGYDDIFLRDRATGTTTRISQPYYGGSGDGISQMGSISANGRHVAYASGSSNLVPNDTNNHWDVFVRDLDQQATVRISVATGGTEGDADSYYPVLSADGRFVAFVSSSTTFAPGVAQYGPNQIYLHDRDADANGIFDEPGGAATELISSGLSGEPADSSVYGPRVSGDGRYVLFESDAANLEATGNLNGFNHLYLRDRSTGQTTLVDQAMTGGPSAWGVMYGTSDMTDDGRYVTFSSVSQDIVWFDMNWQSQVFRYDTIAGPTATEIVSRQPDGTVGDGSSYASSISGDGRYVLFTSAAYNLASPPPSGSEGPAMLAVRDMIDGSFTRVDVLDSGEAFDQPDYYYTPAISADGTAIALHSRSSRALGGAYNPGGTHVFVLTSMSVTPQSASFPMAGGSGSIDVTTTAVTGWSAWSPHPWITVMDGGESGAGSRTVQYFVSSNDAGIVRDGEIRIGAKVIAIHQEGDGDTTPPVITPTITGTLVNGWYTSDISVSWSVTDPDSEIVSQGGCYANTFTTDFLYTQVWCEATSHGGTTVVVMPLAGRDTTGPSITIHAPLPSMYSAGSVVTPSFSCYDPYAGGATCSMTEGSSPLDTTPGHHRVTVTAADSIGNTSTKSVDYVVPTGQCAAPAAAPGNLTHWFMFNGDRVDSIAGVATTGGPVWGTFQPAIAGQGLLLDQAYGYVNGWLGSEALAGPTGLTVALWVKPQGNFYPYSSDYQTLVYNPMQYNIVRWIDGTLRWAFKTTTGFSFVNTGVQLPLNTWQHVAVTYSEGMVRTFVNGGLAHSQALSGSLSTGTNSLVQIGGENNGQIWNRTLRGMLDDVMIFDTALPAADLENLAASAGGSLCVPFASNLTVTAPATVPFGGDFMIWATLTDGVGRPLANRALTVTSTTTPGFEQQIQLTDEDGKLWAVLPTSPEAPIGAHPDGITVSFAGDSAFAPLDAHASITVLPASPLIQWSPGTIAYGTPLGAAQLSASAEYEGVAVPGTAVYAPPAGTVLDAGTHTISVTFTPDDPHYAEVTEQRSLQVFKAGVSMGFSNLTRTYNGQPQAPTITVTGVNGQQLSPFTVTYDGSTSVPVNAGAYSLQVQYAGDTNYIPATSTVTFTINKAAPTVDFATTTVWYTGTPRTATVFVRGVGGVELNPVTVLYNGSTTAPVNAGTYALEAQFAGNGNYSPVAQASSFVIRKALPIFPTLVNYGYTYDGQPHGVNVTVIGVQNEPLPVVTTYNGSTDVPVVAGEYAGIVRYDGSANYEADSRTFGLTIFQATPQLSWGIPTVLTYGQPLGPNQLKATANIPGTFAYTPPAGTILPAGSTLLTATFTPTDANYKVVSTTRFVTVLKANPQLAWAHPADIVYGTELSGTQLNATANTSGTFVYNPPAGTVLAAGIRNLSATFTPDDLANYNAGNNVGAWINVVKATTTVSWSAPPDIVYGTALSAVQLNATANVPGTFTYTPAAGAVLGAGAQTLSVTFTPSDSANYSSTTSSVTLNVAKASTSINWANPGDIVYGAALGAAQLNATANVAGTFSYSPAAGTVLNAGAHTLSVTFTPDDAENYSASTSSVTLNVAKASTSINWPNPSDIVYGAALGAAQLNATANVAGTFSYSPAAGTVLSAGSHTLSVTFTPDDAANYNASTSSVTLNVVKASTSINWSNPGDIVYGAALGAAQLNATANVAGTFTYSPAAGTALNAGAHTLSVTFTPADAANYSASTSSVTLNVAKASTSINWSNPSDIVYGAALGAAQLNATANVVGTFSYSPAEGTLLSAGSHTLSVTFTPADAANYNASTSSVTLNVAKASTSISWANPGDIVYGAALGAAELNATANVAGTFSYSPAAGTALNAGAHTLSVTFTPDDGANYSASTSSVTLNVAKASTSINWSNPSDIVYGAALGAAQLNATANVVGTFSYSPAAGTLLSAGSHTLSVTFTPDDAANYSASVSSVSINVAKASTLINWSNPAGITYGTALTGTHLNATANVAGSFAYSPSPGTVLGAGTQTLSVTFTPADTANYSGSSASVSIAIAPKALTVQTDNAAKVYGAELPAFTAIGTGFVNGDSMASLSGTLNFSTAATATSAPGSYAVTPAGVSSANYTITFAAGALTVSKADTSLTLTTTPSPSNNNQSVQIRAVIAAVVPGAGTATGTVEFRENGNLLGTATLVNGVATMNKNFKKGTHPLTATYAGNTNFNGSSGARTHQTQ